MQTIKYNVSGMTCMGCVSTVIRLLSDVKGVNDVKVSLQPPIAAITTNTSIPVSILNTALDGKYVLQTESLSIGEEEKGFLETYKPILIIAGYILGIAIIKQWSVGIFSLSTFMNDFMAGFFLVFSFFKLLDIKGFANSYGMYDIIAKRIKLYAYLYPFIELALGIAYFTGYNPILTNTITAIVMGISSIGVLQNAFSKNQIQCACLGTLFKLPVSTVTIIEDLLMFAMSVGMLIMLNQ